MTQRTSIAIIGMGGIGGVVASCLQLSGRHQIVVCARRNAEAVTLEQPQGIHRLTLDVVTDPLQADHVDWIILCTKTQDTASASGWFERLCGPSTCVAVLQNGIEHERRVAPYVGSRAVVPAVVYFNGERRSASDFGFRHASEDDIAIPDSATGQAFAALFEGTSLKVSPRQDFPQRLWTKLLLNAVANPITALTRRRLAVFQRGDIHSVASDIIQEGLAVALACGVDLGEKAQSQVLARLLSYHPDVATSMYFDTVNGRILEVDALTGAIVRMGELCGVPTPTNRILLALLQAVSDGAKLEERR
ncbi:2-dehydropantoate 2-reductase [Paraburkholderia jirisanensis]